MRGQNAGQGRALRNGEMQMNSVGAVAVKERRGEKQSEGGGVKQQVRVSGSR